MLFVLMLLYDEGYLPFTLFRHRRHSYEEDACRRGHAKRFRRRGLGYS